MRPSSAVDGDDHGSRCWSSATTASSQVTCGLQRVMVPGAWWRTPPQARVAMRGPPRGPAAGTSMACREDRGRREHGEQRSREEEGLGQGLLDRGSEAGRMRSGPPVARLVGRGGEAGWGSRGER